MAIAARKGCRYGRCSALVPSNGPAYCPEHLRKMEGIWLERRNDADLRYRHTPRAKESKAFLDSKEWQQLRDMKLATHPFCQQCERAGAVTLATDVDHIESRATRPDLALVFENLQSLCKPCHSRKTRSEQRS